MLLDPQSMTPAAVYSAMICCIAPRPIAWVSTCSAEGNVNLAPFSYFNGVCSHPPCLMFSPVNRADGSKKDTLRNIEQTGEFVINVVPFALAEQMHQTSADYPPEVDEMATVGVTPLASHKVRPPRVAQSPIHFECLLDRIVPIGQGPLAANLVLGRILLIHVDDRILDAQGKIDPQQLDAIGRMGGGQYALTRQRFELPPPTV